MVDYFKNFLQRGKYQVPINTPSIALLGNIAYWICLFVGIAGILLLICGYKKGGKLTVLSTVVYWIIVAVCSI